MSDKRKYEDDDGRTIADMSDVTRGPFGGSFRPLTGHEHRKKNYSMSESKQEERPWEKSDLTVKERLMYTLGALKAALLIGFAYIAGLGLLVILILLLWRML